MSDTQTTAPAAPEHVPTPSELGRWAVPPETASVLQSIDSAIAGVLQRLGQLEVDYLASKFPMLEELKQRRATFKTVVDEAARKAGLDIDRVAWRLDTRTMTLIRDP